MFSVQSALGFGFSLRVMEPDLYLIAICDKLIAGEMSRDGPLTNAQCISTKSKEHRHKCVDLSQQCQSSDENLLAQVNNSNHAIRNC